MSGRCGSCEVCTSYERGVTTHLWQVDKDTGTAGGVGLCSVAPQHDCYRQGEINTNTNDTISHTDIN